MDEKITLYGLEVATRKVAFGNINPAEATAIFIRSALVEEDLLPNTRPSRAGEDEDDSDDTRVLRSVAPVVKPLPPQYAFIEDNRRVRQKIETWQTRVRRHDLTNLDEALYNFYARHLVNVSSLSDLNRYLRGEGNSTALRGDRRRDLTGGAHVLDYDAAAFPDTVSLAGQPVELSYAYTPGEESDGVTVKLGFSLAESVSPASVEWAIPGLREGQVNELLRALPKALRRELMPFPPKVAEITRDLQPTGQSLQADLARFIRQRYGVEIPPDAWPADAVPAHLRPRVELVGNDQKILGTGRDLNQLRQRLVKEAVKAPPSGEDPRWARFAQQWEQFELQGWTFGDLPARLTVSESGAVPLYAWPGIDGAGDGISLRLYRTEDAARRATLGGIQKLALPLPCKKTSLGATRIPALLALYAPLINGFTSVDDLTEAAYENLTRHILSESKFSPRLRKPITTAPSRPAELSYPASP